MSSSKFDELLSQLGTGKWNYMFFFATSYWNMHLAPHVLGGAFLAPKVGYTCLPPEGGYTLTSTVVSETDGTKSNYTNQCEYLANTTIEGGGLEPQACKEWQFDNTTYVKTLTSEFDLVCSSEYLRATYQSMYMLGTFFGAPICGLLADKFGRKTILSIGTIAYSIIGIGTCWLPNFPTILTSRFLMGFLHSSGLVTGYILSMEVCEPRHRSILGIVLAFPWALGTIVWGGLAYFLRDWQWLQLCISLIAVPFFPVLWFIDESPRWLIVEGKFQRANKVLQRAARWNGVSLPPQEELNLLMRSIQKESALAKQETTQEQDEPLGCKQKVLKHVLQLFILFRTPKLRMITIILYLKFFCVSMVFYGLSLNAVNYSANPFVYMMLGGLAEVPAYTVTAPIVATLGRRIPTILLYLLSGATIFALAFISSEDPRFSAPRSSPSLGDIRVVEDMILGPKEYLGPPSPPHLTWLVMTLAMIGKMCISAAYQVLYLYSTELFPTEVRMQAMGSANVASRIGSMGSPFITELLGPLYPRAPSIIFGLGAFIAGIATIPLHETLGKPLPDTISDLENTSQTPIDRLPDEQDEETEMAKLRA